MAKKIIAALCLAACMTVIFIFSSQNGEVSGELSGGITYWIAEKTVSGFSDMTPEKQTEIVESMHLYVRKAAHFSVYALLGVIAFINVSLYTSKKAKCFLISLPFCLLYAASDEFHQLFTAERCGSPVDVMIDFSGSVTGTVAIFIILKLIASRNKKIS